ncbi:MAG TPA: formyltransferase family protein [Candidatus Eremiobacteraceae bacterium]|nr:formyltransferase family protein [Candidatus Eremiobacteraceae bacterium]
MRPGGRPILVPTAVFASGNGSNLQAVIDASAAGTLPLDIRLVVTNNPKALALARAARANIPALVIPFLKAHESRSDYGIRLARAVRAKGVQLVLLLGWMHVLAREFVDAGFAGILNLHPAYLPEDPRADRVTFPDGTTTRVFRGAHALRDALEAGVTMTGATLIEITPEIDRGYVLARRTFAFADGDDEKKALERLHDVEREVVREGVLVWLRTHHHG